MTQRLKRWESPRNEGRNDKGRGGSARQRQLRKKYQNLRQKLKKQTDNQETPEGREPKFSSFLFVRSEEISYGDRHLV